MGPSLSSEHRVILAAARVDAARWSGSLARLTAGPLDWPRLARLAAEHGVGALVFHALSGSGVVAADDQRVAMLRQQFFASAGNSFVLARELLDVLARLPRVGVPAISYKGPALAALLYGDVGLREFSDLDILVKPADVQRVKQELLASGYEPQTPITPAQLARLLRSRAEYYLRFDRPVGAGRIALELHWRIPATFSFGEDVWQRLQPVPLLGGKVPHFAVDDLLLILCAHGFKHGWSRLKWVCDVRELWSRYPDLDWDSVLARASRLGGRRILLVGCALARELLEAALPRAAIQAIEADRIASALSRGFVQNFSRPTSQVGLAGNVRVRERARDKLHYGLALLGRVTIPAWSERAAWPRSGRAALGYRVAHPFRIAARILSKRSR